MNQNSDEARDFEVERQLHSLQPVPERDPKAAARGRARFLEQSARMASLQKQKTRPQAAVSAAGNRRHNGWFDQIFRKELPRMSAITTVLLIVALVFGGSGAAYAASQDALPEQPLYALKVAGEDLQIQFTANQQSRMELALKFSQRRVDEITRMNAAGQTAPQQVQTRWQQQVQTALELANNLPDEAARTQALSKVRTRLQAEIQALGSATGEPQMERTRLMIQAQLQQVDQIMGGVGPGGKPEESPQGNPNQYGPGGPNGNGAARPGDDTPQGANPWTSGTPTPGSSYGPGPGTCDTCTPQGTSQGGSNPWTTGTPTPGSGYGPGPGTCETCTPQGMTNTPQSVGHTPQAKTPQASNTPQGGNTPQGKQNPYTTGTPTPGSSYGPGPGSMTNTPAGPRKP